MKVSSQSRRKTRVCRNRLRRSGILGRSHDGSWPGAFHFTEIWHMFVHLQWGPHISDWGYIVARGVDSRFTDGRVGVYLLTPH
jgi:hypothetical protein